MSQARPSILILNKTYPTRNWHVPTPRHARAFWLWGLFCQKQLIFDPYFQILAQVLFNLTILCKHLARHPCCQTFITIIKLHISVPLLTQCSIAVKQSHIAARNRRLESIFTPCKGTPEPHDMSVPPGAHTVNRPLRSPGCRTEPTFLGYIAPEPRPSRVWPLMYPPLARWEPRSEQVGIKSTCRFNQVLGLPFSQNSRHVIGTFNNLTDNTNTLVLSMFSILGRGVDPPSVTIPAPIQDHFKLPI